jgi:putative isomerase
MFTGFLPLWCGIASAEQARILVERHFRNEREFNAPWGLRSLAMSERMYAPATDSANPSNWLGPVWIVASYMVYEGLKRYNYSSDAALLAGKTRLLLEKDLLESGAMHECYDPDTGRPNFNTDFLSWNVLALLMV